MGELGKRWNEVLPYILDFFNTVDDDKKIEVAQKIKNFYGIEDEITLKNVTGLTKVTEPPSNRLLFILIICFQLFSDRFFFVDAEKALRLHAKSSESPIYYFKFSYILEQDSMFGSLLPVPGF